MRLAQLVGQLLSCGILLTGCAGKVDYRPPLAGAVVVNSKKFSFSKDVIWPKLISGLSRRFFIINNVDKSSGLINISYSGDPEKYVDCGQMTSYVKNARGERTYSFPGSREHEVYEVMTGGQLVYLDRHMSLDGRINVIVEEAANTESLVTVNVKYVVQKNVNLSDPIGHQASLNETLSFNTGASASFSNSGVHALCRATGELEVEILSSIN